MRRVYLDHNATSPLRPRARDTLEELLGGRALGNPSSAHAEGRRARQVLENARERLAKLLDCHRDEVVFTSGGTESNALALRAAAGGPASISPLEHPSLLAWSVGPPGTTGISIDRAGRVAVDARALASRGSRLVSIGLANHETGVIQDWAGLAPTLRAGGILCHADASQALGRIPLSFRNLGVDLMTVSAHKLGGPPGVGALILRQGLELRPLLQGGAQEGGLRPGTEAVLLAAAFAAAAEEACEDLPAAGPRWQALREELRQGVASLDREVIFHTPEIASLPNTLNVSFPGRSGTSLVHRLDLDGVSVSHGSACASGSLEPSPVLLAMGVSSALSSASIRVSMGHDTLHADVIEFLARLSRVLACVPRRGAPRFSARTSNDE